MARCPLCKTPYPDGVSVCKIDGTRLAVERTASVLLPSIEARNNHTQGLSESDLQPLASRERRPAGKGRAPGGGLASLTEDVTTAAKPDALAARARGHEDPPRIATGSGTVAPTSKQKDNWSAPFVDAAPGGLDSQNSDEWVGRTLGSYKLISILGKGGMGCVYRAEHTKLGREVALKVLRSDYAKRRDAVARFFQEARSVNKVRHRNIVDITDLVELDAGIVFIIMEYLEGTSLTKVMRSGSSVDAVRALSILVQICDGLAAAHSVGIVHRDLKPDNIIVCKEGDKDLVKLLDFGVAKLLDKDEDDDIGLMTVAGSVVGTPAFMSPEQAGGLQVDGRADIYSLGAIMYEMFARQPLFRGKSFGEFVRMHLNDKPTPPSQTPGGRDIHPRVEEVIMMCLEKSPDARFQTAQEMRTELLSLLATLETGGEMTAHLEQHRQSAMPIGEAMPKRAVAAAAPVLPRLPVAKESPAMAAAQVPAFYRLPAEPSDEFTERPSEQVLVSHSSEAMANSGYGAHPSGPQPLYTPNAAYPPGTPMPLPGYSETNMRFQGVTNTAVRAPARRNYRGVGLGLGIGLAAIIALVVATGSKDPKPGNDQAGTAEAPAATLDTDPAPASDEAEAETRAGGVIVPTVTPPPGKRVIVVALSSEPSAKVFAVGAVSPVCQSTPCDLRIDTADGGSANRRDYILRSPDHLDSTITINLRAPRDEVFVTLDPINKKTDPLLVAPIEHVKSTGPKNPATPDGDKPIRKQNNTKVEKKPKCKASAQDTFNPFGEDEEPCAR